MNGQKLINTPIIVQPCKKDQIAKEVENKEVTIELKLADVSKMEDINAIFNSHCPPPRHMEYIDEKVIVTFVNLVHAQKVVRKLRNANCEFDLLLQ